MPLGGLARVGGPSALGVAAFTFEDDETQPGSFKITACGVRSGRPKSRNASSSASSRVGGARQARGSRPGAVSLAAGHLAGDNRRRDHGPGPAAYAPRTALAGVVTVCLRGRQI